MPLPPPLPALPPAAAPDPTLAKALTETRAWVTHAVIGLNLCPFAKAVESKGLVRYVASDASDAAGVLAALRVELQALVAAPATQVETTVLVLPNALADFLEFNDLVGRADRLLRKLGLEGEIQLATFHPRYQFAGTTADDITNATNRAPWPSLHLLRESSIDRAVAAMPEAEAIYENNLATLKRLGPEGWQAVLAACVADMPFESAPAQLGPSIKA